MQRKAEKAWEKMVEKEKKWRSKALISTTKNSIIFAFALFDMREKTAHKTFSQKNVRFSPSKISRATEGQPIAQQPNQKRN